MESTARRASQQLITQLVLASFQVFTGQIQAHAKEIKFINKLIQILMPLNNGKSEHAVAVSSLQSSSGLALHTLDFSQGFAIFAIWLRLR